MTKLIPIIVLFLFSACSSKVPTKSVKVKKAEIYYQSGTSSLVKKDYRGALKDLRESYKLVPDDTNTLNNLGMAYYLRGDIERGFHFIQKSLKVDPKNAEARTNLASVYMSKNKIDQAEKHYKIVLEDLVYRSQYRTHYNLALIEGRRGSMDKAKNHLLSAIKIEKSYCPAHHELGLIFRGEKKYKESLKHFKNGIKGTCYGKVATHFQIGKGLALLGKNKKALDKFQLIKESFAESQYVPLAESEISRLRQQKYLEFRRNKLPNQNQRKTIYNNSKRDDVSSPKF